jgi:hypothetical protein
MSRRSPLTGRHARMTRCAAALVTVVATLGTPAAGAAQPPGASSAVRGTVFLDRDADGARDAGEPGIAGVRVSNQDTVVVTDAAGAFRLPDAGRGIVFVTVPDRHRAVGSFWRAAPADGAPLAFALAARPAVRAFTFVHASDTHVSEQSAARLRRLRALVDSVRPAFTLVTGDLVRDALRVGEAEARGYYELFEREARQFATPVWTIPGNHELFGIERDRSGVAATHPLLGRGMYRLYRGPDYYSFDHGGVHFVGLNTVDVHDGRWYHGHVDSLQLAWLRSDLALVAPTTPVVTFDHIPFFSTAEELNGYMEGPPAPSLITLGGRPTFRHVVSNAGEVLAVLRARRHVLALGGHIHMRERLQYEIDGAPVRFEQSAATVGPSDAAGMRFPSGFTVYQVRDGVIDAGRFVPLDPAATATP